MDCPSDLFGVVSAVADAADAGCDCLVVDAAFGFGSGGVADIAVGIVASGAEIVC